MNKNKSKEESRPTKKGHHDQRKESDLKTTLLLNKSESKIVRLEEDEEEEEKGNLDKTIIYREKGIVKIKLYLHLNFIFFEVIRFCNHL